ncbi:copper amine oxidase N-terminal domain-containing protein [Paenibacillus sp. HN-1]|uniref:copper amine oxidase N-terminal domain-containing protein n=1 Tax=Paenibacillus TaxID=44249 RepID=UPI001CAA1819|nr:MULTISPECIES: copper amine oxidase N-terminal domain-containing protein [Paenibacillus]MBY9082260.1 copper amine oxidase N-terminal domain-containing protein [Paenibacillus sp. CGMCC 1.18879]MBY9086376.1 copper amine oxidase N-terminal domain-containing protein [Paenibacillus sinensis]
MKLRNKKVKWLLPILALLLVLAGCQTVGGLDVNKALLGNLDVKSAEESVTFSMKAVPAAGISDEDRKIVDLINSFSVQVNSLKLQENGDMSASGALALKGKTVPFSLYINKSVLALNVEGAKKPFYYPLEDYNSVLSESGVDLEKAESLNKLLTSFVVKNLPNPSAISASAVTDTVYGEQLNLMKLHAEVTGEELPALLKSFLKSVSQDSEGFKQFLGGLYDYLLPVLKSEEATDLLDEYGFGDVPLDDKEQVVTVAHDAAKLAIDTVLLMYDKKQQELYDNIPEIKTVLGKDTNLKVDLFVDSSLHVRKEQMSLNVALPQDDSIPITSISFQSEAQVWNINGPVKADVIDTAGGFNASESSMSPGTLLQNLNSDSALYRLLKEDLGITRRSIAIDPEFKKYIIEYKGNTAMVSANYLAAFLGANLEWDEKSRGITITDDLFGTTIALKVGFKQATVDGAVIKLPQAVYIDEYGRGMVPLRTVAEALHAKVSVEEDGTINITRD